MEIMFPSKKKKPQKTNNNKTLSHWAAGDCPKSENISVTLELAKKTLDSKSKQAIINEYGTATSGRRRALN